MSTTTTTLDPTTDQAPTTPAPVVDPTTSPTVRPCDVCADPSTTTRRGEGETLHVCDPCAVELDDIETAVGTYRLTLDASTFLAAYCAVRAVSSKEPGREILQTVALDVTADGRSVTLTATDSYRLATVDLPADAMPAHAGAWWHGRTVLLGQLAASDTALRTLAKGARFVTVAFSPHPDGAYLAGTWALEVDGPTGGRVTGESIAGDYPRWRGLFPTTTPGDRCEFTSGAYAFNPDYLAALGKLARTFVGKDPGTVRVDHVRDNGPAAWSVHHERGHLRYLLMPVRV